MQPHNQDGSQLFVVLAKVYLYSITPILSHSKAGQNNIFDTAQTATLVIHNCHILNIYYWSSSFQQDIHHSL